MENKEFIEGEFYVIIKKSDIIPPNLIHKIQKDEDYPELLRSAQFINRFFAERGIFKWEFLGLKNRF